MVYFNPVTKLEPLLLVFTKYLICSVDNMELCSVTVIGNVVRINLNDGEIIGYKRKKITEMWELLHFELYDSYSI
jgi:hypothetical protein